MRILAIETSCDETALAIVEASGGLRAPKFRVLKNLVASQIKIHQPFGGVVPNLAKREHLKNLPVLYRQIFGKSQTASSKWGRIDLIAVTVGPGLEPALWAGISFANELRKRYQASGIRCQVLGANHLEGHLYSFLLTKSCKLKAKSLFPAIALIASGGHTILLKMDSLTKWKKLGETRDDAAGEAFDKVARLLGLPYPGGPEIEKLATASRRLTRTARAGDRGQAQTSINKLYSGGTINFPRPMLNQKNYDFSFSGLKTAVLYYLRDAKKSRIRANDANDSTAPTISNSRNSHELALSSRRLADVAASFQDAVIDVLVAKTMRAAREFGAKSIMLSGGVAANKTLRKALNVKCQTSGVKFLVPDLKYNLDNAAMIAVAGYFTHLRNRKYPLRAKGNLGI